VACLNASSRNPAHNHPVIEEMINYFNIFAAGSASRQ
jgi:hypothetical protein